MNSQHLHNDFPFSDAVYDPIHPDTERPITLQLALEDLSNMGISAQLVKPVFELQAVLTAKVS